MKTVLNILFVVSAAILLLPAFSLAGSATISWNANAEEDLAGYRIYYSTTKGGPYGSSTALIPKSQTSYTISDLSDGTYYFVVTAIDNSSNESVYSSEVSKTITSTSASSTSTGTASSLFSLPASGIYGMVSGSASRTQEVSFTFSGRTGNVKVYYEVYDVNSRREVSILINGKTAGFARKTKKNEWSAVRSITIKDAYINDSTTNTLTFRNSGPSNSWGVQSISIK